MRQMVADDKVGQNLSNTVKKSYRADTFRQMLANGNCWHPGKTPAEFLEKASQANTS